MILLLLHFRCLTDCFGSFQILKNDRLEDSFANFRSKTLLKKSDQVGQGRRAALFTGPADNLSPCEKLPVV